MVSEYWWSPYVQNQANQITALGVEMEEETQIPGDIWK